MKVQSLTGEIVETKCPEEATKFYLTACFEISKYKRHGFRIYRHDASGSWAVCVGSRWYVADTLHGIYNKMDQLTGKIECTQWNPATQKREKIDPLVKWKKSEVQMEDCE